MRQRRPDGESIAPRDQGVWLHAGRLATFVTLVLLAATACAAMAPFHWFAELGVHFPVQYAGLALIAFVILAWARRVGWAALALIIAAINAAIAAPVINAAPLQSPDYGADGIPLRVASVNVLFTSNDYERVLAFTRTQRPDVVLFSEVTERWREALDALEREYPYRFSTQGPDGRGLTLMSRWPLAHADVLPLEDASEPAIDATAVIRGQRVHLFGVHANWPMGKRTAFRRNQQLAQLATAARMHPRPLIVVGDLNISPFSPHFAALVAHSGLRSAAAGFGWQPTWPTLMPPAGIQIDHALVSSDVAVRAFRHGAYVGSDHRPIVVDLVVRGL